MSLIVGVDVSWRVAAVVGRQLGISRVELEGRAGIAHAMPEHARCVRFLSHAWHPPSVRPTPIPNPLPPPSSAHARNEAAAMQEAGAQLRASPFFRCLDDGGCYSLILLDKTRPVFAMSPPLEALFKWGGEMVEELLRHKTLHFLLNAA